MTNTTPARVLTLWTPKGGTGCSTIAAALAITDRDRDPDPDGHRLMVDASPAGDLDALLGMVAMDRDLFAVRPVAPNLVLATTGPTDHRAALAYTDTPHARAVIVDLGTAPRHALELTEYPTHAPRPFRLAVIGADYLSLRATTTSDTGRRQLEQTDAVLMVTNEGAALGARDVTDVTGRPVIATVTRDAQTQRSIDAGILPSRLPDELRRAALAVLRAADRRLASVTP